MKRPKLYRTEHGWVTRGEAIGFVMLLIGCSHDHAAKVLDEFAEDVPDSVAHDDEIRMH